MYKKIKLKLYYIKEALRTLFAYPEVQSTWEGRIDYDEYWKSKRGEGKAYLSKWQKRRAWRIAGLIEPESTILDIGCGDGTLLKYLEDKNNIKGIGVDVSEKILVLAKEVGVETIKMDISEDESISKLPVVDYVLGIELIEHLPDPEVFISRLREKANKALIFSFPNTGYFMHRLRLLFGRFPLQWMVHPGEHLRFWTVKDVRWWARAMGYDMEKLIVYEGFPILNKILPNLFGQGIIIKLNVKKNN